MAKLFSFKKKIGFPIIYHKNIVENIENTNSLPQNSLHICYLMINLLKTTMLSKARIYNQKKKNDGREQKKKRKPFQ